MNKLVETLQKTTELFEARDIPNPRFDAEMIIAFSLNMKRLDLYLNFDMPLGKPELDKIRPLILKRANRYPLQYLLGKSGFMDMELIVAPGVLIPRPETEILVEKCFDWLHEQAFEKPDILDLCTGAGPIAISLAREFKNADIVCTDISDQALDICHKNVALFSLANLKVVKSDLDTGLDSDKKFNLITSNPPYINTSNLIELMPEVIRFEPRLALDGGNDGLVFYKRLITTAQKRLLKGGRIYMETGHDQAKKIATMFFNSGFTTEIIKDYSGVERIVFAEFGR